LRTTALAIAVGILASACTVSQPARSPAPTHAGCAAAATAASLCIVVLGDSIGVGAPLTGDDRWWPQLRRLLEADLPGRSVVVDNWAVSGSQIDLLEAVARDPALGSYDLAMIFEGVNDVQVDLPITAWQPRYEAAIAAIEAAGTSVILATPPPQVSGDAFDTRFDGLAEAIRSLARSDRPTLDLAARWRADGAIAATSYYVDHIHQSAAGQARMATLARDVVLEAIGRLSPARS
jgi:lysophospholipase L1-like esterase